MVDSVFSQGEIKWIEEHSNLVEGCRNQIGLNTVVSELGNWAANPLIFGIKLALAVAYLDGVESIINVSRSGNGFFEKELTLPNFDSLIVSKSFKPTNPIPSEIEMMARVGMHKTFIDIFKIDPPIFKKIIQKAKVVIRW